MSEYVRIAIRVITCFDRVVKEIARTSDYRSSALTARLNDFPALAANAGIAPALTFFLSKLSDEKEKDAFVHAYRAIKSGECKVRIDQLDRKTRNNLINYFRNELPSKEGKGYGPALALILASLEQVGYIKMEGAPSGVRDIAQAISEVLDGAEASDLEALEVLAELKKLGQAFYK